eukprot:625802-Pleurochrysis_carterae.AAC.4
MSVAHLCGSAVEPPAHGVALARDGGGVAGARRDANHIRARVDECVDASRRRRLVHRATQSELPAPVAPPRVDVPLSARSERVRVGRRDDGDGDVRVRAQLELARRQLRRRRLVAERRPVRAPRPDGAALAQRERVVETRRDGDDAHARQSHARRQHDGRLVAVAKPATDAEAARVHAAALVDDERVVLRHGDGARTREGRHLSAAGRHRQRRRRLATAERHVARLAPRKDVA